MDRANIGNGLGLSAWLGMLLLAIVLVLLRIVPLHYSYLKEKAASCLSSMHTSDSPYGTWDEDKEVCPQPPALYPSSGGNSKLLKELEDVYHTESFQNRSAAWLSGAVKIPSVSYDDMLPVGKDPRWEVFGDLHDYFASAFPLTWKHLNVTKVNTYALAIHWQGSNESLKPILLAGHQDVVPVEPTTVDEWKYPPFSGHYDGKLIYGRGSGDDKSGTVGILCTFETLLEKGFKPRRTIVFASGIDEESAGVQGAGELAKHLEKRYGRDAFAILVDEGGGMVEEHGIYLAMPHVAEKGYLDVRIEVSTPGGHSSIPPAHTSIGLLAQAIGLLESHPHTPHLTRDSIFYAAILCMPDNAPLMPESLKELIRASRKSDAAFKLLESMVLSEVGTAKGNRALLSTTQAVDLIEGGVKVNALPERASAVVNHRIATESSVGELTEHLANLFAPLAAKYNLTFDSFSSSAMNTSASAASSGSLRLSDAFNSALEPAPVTPTDTEAFRVLAGSIQATQADSLIPNPKNQSMIVAPYIAGGNTDTQFYWNLTRHIYRYSHLPAFGFDLEGGIHTVNEAIPAKTFVEGIRFFANLIINADEADKL